jgi:hypothetical protein
MGVILYQLLVGDCPFLGDTIPELYDSILNREPWLPANLSRATSLHERFGTSCVVSTIACLPRAFGAPKLQAATARGWQSAQLVGNAVATHRATPRGTSLQVGSLDSSDADMATSIANKAKPTEVFTMGH